MLEDFGADWGQAVAVSQREVLVVAYANHWPRALLWSLDSGRFREVGGSDGVNPVALTPDGTVLGKVNTKTGDALAVISRANARWEALGTDPGCYATAINERGDAAGSKVVDGFERPWLRRSNGEIVWLPFYSHHWCRPTALSASGTVVGYAQADHGYHALMWTTRR